MTLWIRGLWPRTVVVVALALFAWTHRYAFEMSGFADDLGLLVDLTERAQRGDLFLHVLARLTNPLWPGSTMWRPLPYASFAVDAVLWGTDAGLWRITNVGLHLASAAITGLICRDLTEHPRAGAVGFAVFLLTPWSSEVVVWLAGRFDGWATLAILLSLWAALKSQGVDRWWALSLAAGACAYASKESALILPVWVAVVALNASYHEGWGELPFKSVLGRIFSQRGALLIAHVLLAAAYLIGRTILFSTSSLDVYAAGPQLDPMDLASRFLAHAQFPLGLAPLAPKAAWVVGISFIAVAAIALRKNQKSDVAMGLFFLVTVVSAVAAYFATAPGNGEGYRFYYLATLGFALIAAGASTSPLRITPVVTIALLVAMAFWQARVTDEWQRASIEMKASETALNRAASAMMPQDYGLVLLPDHLGHVPFARNAQAALPKLAGRPTPSLDVLSKLVIFTPPQIDEWHRLTQEGVVRKITSRTDAPPNPTQYFCFDSRTLTLQALGYSAPGTLEDWRRNWRVSTDAACPRVATTDG